LLLLLSRRHNKCSSRSDRLHLRLDGRVLVLTRHRGPTTQQASRHKCRLLGCWSDHLNTHVKHRNNNLTICKIFTSGFTVRLVYAVINSKWIYCMMRQRMKFCFVSAWISGWREKAATSISNCRTGIKAEKLFLPFLFYQGVIIIDK
jgi:hypothetical protein